MFDYLRVAEGADGRTGGLGLLHILLQTAAIFSLLATKHVYRGKIYNSGVWSR